MIVLLANWPEIDSVSVAGRSCCPLRPNNGKLTQILNDSFIAYMSISSYRSIFDLAMRRELCELPNVKVLEVIHTHTPLC